MAQDQRTAKNGVAHLGTEPLQTPPERCSMIGATVDVDDCRKAAEQERWQVTLESEDDAHHEELATTITDRHPFFRLHEELFGTIPLRTGKVAGQRERRTACQ